jgi:hypothetical protein
MKGITKATTAIAVALTLGACSSMNTIEVRQTKANPNWYEDCEQIGSEGFLFWKDDYAYACGMGESKYEQASEAQAYAFAVKGFAERINGTVNSFTEVDINNDRRTTQTYVKHSVEDTIIREHLEVRKKSYELEATGNVHTYVRIKMPLETFNALIIEATDDTNIASIN